MKIKIEIETSSNAFGENRKLDNARLAAELKKIFNDLIERIETENCVSSHRVFDSDGTRCGTVVVE